MSVVSGGEAAAHLRLPPDAAWLTKRPLVMPSGGSSVLVRQLLDIVSPSLMVLVAAGVTTSVAGVVVLRARLKRRALAARATVALVPTDGFDPTAEEVVRFASELARVRPAVHRLTPRSAAAARIRFVSVAGGQLAMTVEVPARSASVLRLGGYQAVEQVSPDTLGHLAAPSGVGGGDPTGEDDRPPRSSKTTAGLVEEGGDPTGAVDAPSRWLRRRPRRTEASAQVARAELLLARDDALPLRLVPLRPDPLTGIARAMAAVKNGLGESVELALDLLPLTPAQRRHRRRRAVAGGGGGSSRMARLTREISDGFGGLGPLDSFLGINREDSGTRPPRQEPDALARLEERATTQVRAAKLTSSDPFFAVQLLVRARSSAAGRAEAHVQAVVAGLEQYAGDNWWRVAGLNLGIAHLDGADAPWRRRRFDRRMDSGEFAPRRRQVVTATEIAGLLKPPTVHCPAANIVRSGGVVPPPPPGLPTYRPDAPESDDLLPLGTVRTADGDRPVAVRLADTYFSLMTGRSRYGKTESALVRFVALARAGHGCLFLDPHADALAKVKPYLTSVAKRVLEIDLSPRARDGRQAGWNLFSMQGRSAEDVEGRVAAVVNSFASALGWSSVNNRAMTVTTMAAQSLCELALVLPADTAPTIFQMTTILANDDWREAVLAYLSPASRDFWVSRFPRLEAGAITPVTNLVDRLRSASAVAALLGSSVSTYDVRRAMDRGQVVLACPAGSGDKDRLVANFLVHDLLQAALRRRDIPFEKRRPFHCFVDELQKIDGASGNNLAALLEESGKFGVRLHAMSQDPQRLTAPTLEALLTNRSHLLSTVVGSASARLLAAEWGNRVRPETITSLPRYHFLASVTFAGAVSGPFLVRGFELEELWGDACDLEGVEALDLAIDRNLHRQPVAETLAALDTLDDRILAALAGRRAGSHPTEQSPGGPVEPTRGSGLRVFFD